MLLIATWTTSTVSVAKLWHLLLDCRGADMNSTGGIKGGVCWKTIKTTLIYDAVIILIGVDSVLSRMDLVMFFIPNIWLGKKPLKIARKAVEISITGEHLVASIAREMAFLCPLTYLCLIASNNWDVSCWTSYSMIQETLSWALIKIYPTYWWCSSKVSW